jgi:hypothetical protein
MAGYFSTYGYEDELYILSTNQVGIVQGIQIIDIFDSNGNRIVTEKYLMKPKKKSIYSYNWSTWYPKDNLQLREPSSEEVECYKKSKEVDITILLSQINTCLDYMNMGIMKDYYKNLASLYQNEINEILNK